MSSFIHSSSIIEDGATIGNDCTIGPFCTIGKDVILGNNVKLKSHVVIDGHTKIGDGTVVYPFSSLGQIPQDLKFKNEVSYLEIGCNTVIRESVTASVGTKGGGLYTKIGDNCLIMAYCHVAHDCKIGNNVILVNGVNLGGHVKIDDYAIVGGLTAVRQFVRIGKHAIVGGFTGVDRDVIPYGNVRNKRSATIRGLNIVGMKRSGMSAKDISYIDDAFNMLFSEDNKLFTEKIATVKKQYCDNECVMEIVEFLLEQSKTPICTTKPADGD